MPTTSYTYNDVSEVGVLGVEVLLQITEGRLWEMKFPLRLVRLMRYAQLLIVDELAQHLNNLRCGRIAVDAQTVL